MIQVWLEGVVESFEMPGPLLRRHLHCGICFFMSTEKGTVITVEEHACTGRFIHPGFLFYFAASSVVCIVANISIVWFLYIFLVCIVLIFDHITRVIYELIHKVVASSWLNDGLYVRLDAFTLVKNFLTKFNLFI